MDEPPPAPPAPAEDGATTGQETSTGLVPVDTIPVQTPLERRLTERQETARLYLAVFFAALFVATVLLSYGSLVWGTHWAATKEWLQILLPAETALLGSAVGFYFGAKR